MPARRQRAGFCFTIADDAGNDEVGVVERGTEGMRQGIPQFTAFMDRSGRFRRDVTGNAVGPGKLAEQFTHACDTAVDMRVDLGVGTFEIRVGDEPGPAVSWPDHVDHVQVALDDGAVEMGVDEVEARGGAPVAEQAMLDVFLRQRLVEQGIVAKVDLSDGEVVGGTPVRMHAAQEIG